MALALKKELLAMGASSLRSLRLAGLVAAGAAAVAAAGCSGSSSAPPAASSAPVTSASAPAVSPSASVSSAPVTAPATASPVASPRTVPSSSEVTGGGGPAGCATRDLQVKAGTSQGAAGSLYLSLDFTNISNATCTLYGYPGVSLAAGTPVAQVGAAAERSTTDAPALVTLAPGQTGNALLRIVQALNYPQATCSPTATTYLQVYPPNQTTPAYLSFKSMGCTSDSVKLLTIGVVQPGAGQQ